MSDSTHELSIHVDFTGRGGWEVELDDTHITCADLGDARRLAFIAAARRRPCELIVRDAYHRVIERRRLGAEAGPPPRG